jgi:hypothetical protein
VAADGPRSNHLGEIEYCMEARCIATQVDWPCDVKTLFRDQNLGCKMGVSSGISWFFDHEEEGIILEDDILPLPTFFDFCDELLERYRNTEKIGLISGSNLISNCFEPPESYLFSHYNLIWGWATWRRAWKHYDVGMKDWPKWRNRGGLKTVSDGGRLFESYWENIFDAVYDGKIDTWDYQLLFALWRRSMLTVIPADNQTWNIGFGRDATHTTTELPQFIIDSKPVPLKFPLSHPLTINRNKHADKKLDRISYAINLTNHLKRKITSIPIIGKYVKKINAKIKLTIKGDDFTKMSVY